MLPHKTLAISWKGGPASATIYAEQAFSFCPELVAVPQCSMCGMIISGWGHLNCAYAAAAYCMLLHTKNTQSYLLSPKTQSCEVNPALMAGLLVLQ